MLARHHQDQYISVYFEAGSLSTFFFTLAWEMQETYQNILFMQPWAPQPISQQPDSLKHLNISALNARTHVHNGKWEQQKRCMLSDIAMKHLFEVFKHLWFPCHRKANNTSYNCGGKQWYLSRDAGLTRPSAPKKGEKSSVQSSSLLECTAVRHFLPMLFDVVLVAVP